MSKETQENYEITDESIQWAYRILLNREPEPQAFETMKAPNENLRDLHKKITFSDEYTRHFVQYERHRDLEAKSPLSLSYRHWVWAWRVLFDRNPHEGEITSELMSTVQTTEELRQYLMKTHEFCMKNAEITIAQPAVLIKEIVENLRIYIDLNDWNDSRQVAIDRVDYTPYLDTFKTLLSQGDHTLDLGHGCGVFTILMAHFVGEQGHVHSYDIEGARQDLLACSVKENHFESRQTTYQTQNSHPLWEQQYKLIRVANAELFTEFRSEIEHHIKKHQAICVYPTEITCFDNLKSHRKRPFNERMHLLEPYPWPES
ncbi:MAG: hypothetical protein AB8C84_10845 [Oligoflexales bacterium]